MSRTPAALVAAILDLGNSAGRQRWKIDLTPYAGRKVELSVSYISDWGTQGAGLFLDDVALTLDGAAAEQTSFEGRPRRLERREPAGGLVPLDSRRAPASPRRTPSTSASAWRARPRRPSGPTWSSGRRST
ncbi:hypothetical protein [Nonomuraea roseoviolacea]|uniref:hypothetical protein n=1 Tax=Nonomuraea roseoviolacea TaxID=103837 RepID=UPI0031DE2AB5